MMKNELEKEDADWAPLQVLKKNFELNNIVSREFIKFLEQEFADKKVDVINFSIYVNNKSKTGKDEKDPSNDIITFSHMTKEYTKEKKVVVDMNNPDSFEKIKKAVEKFDGVD